jgi:hypothetical protein
MLWVGGRMRWGTDLVILLIKLKDFVKDIMIKKIMNSILFLYYYYRINLITKHFIYYYIILKSLKY